MKKLNLLAMGLALPLTTQAALTVSNDFEDASDLDGVSELISLEYDGTVQPGETQAGISLENGMLRLDHGIRFESNSNLFSGIPLGADMRVIAFDDSLQDDYGQATLYFEFMLPEVDGELAKTDVVWGGVNIDASDPDAILGSSYNSYNFMCRVDSGDDSFDLRDEKTDASGQTYFEVIEKYEDVDGVSTPVVFTPEAGVTYQVWSVIDLFDNVSYVYIQGGEKYPEQTQLIGNSEVADNGQCSFRVNPNDEYTEVDVPVLDEEGNPVLDQDGNPVLEDVLHPASTFEYIMIAMSAGNNSATGKAKGDDYLYVDNVGYSMGMDLSSPEGTGPVLPGWVDDATYGTVYVYGDALEVGVWLWQWESETYIYVGEQTAEGDWAWYAK